nr:hypothetical protein [Tanacetum cinerariifolium]
MDASLVVTERSGIESEKNISEYALNKSVNETHMQMHDRKVDMGKALDDGSVITESSGTKSDKRDTSSRSGKDVDTEDAVIRLINDQEPLAEMHDRKVDMGKALDDGQHGQILNETNNKAKIKKKIEVLETVNIEMEHSVAKLLAQNEKLHRENEHLKRTYKYLYDSIKKTRV